MTQESYYLVSHVSFSYYMSKYENRTISVDEYNALPKDTAELSERNKQAPFYFSKKRK